MKRGVLKLGFVSSVFVVSLLLATSPLAAALTYTIAPPYTYGSPSNREWRTELTGTPGQWNADPSQCVAVYTPVWATASSGTGGLHYEVQALLNLEECGDDAGISFFGNQFTPSVAGYYTLTSTWTLSPDPTTGYFEVQGLGFGSVTANLIIHGDLTDLTAGVVLPAWTGTAFSQTGPTILWEWWSTQTYTAQVTGVYLLAGHAYQMWDEFEAKIVADSAGLPGTYIGDLLTSIANPSFTAYISTGGGGCVLAGTPILLANGKKTLPIDKLNAGDEVLGYNVTTGQLVPVTVVSNTYSYVPEVMNINNGTLVVTPADQPLYARNATWQGWLRNPEGLQAGWQLFNPTTQSWVNVTSVMMQNGNFKVYDLKTSQVNDFIANGILADRKP